MIAKRVMRSKGGSFKRLGEYISAQEVAKWQRTAENILDALGTGIRVANIRISNCQSEELDQALAEIAATQERNRRAIGERTYHLIVSFPPGEKPSLAQLRDIEDELCAAIGLARHQRLSAVHTDTAHLHIHVAINQIHPQSFACIEPWYDKARLMAACDRLEVKHGLQRTCHGDSKAKAPPGRAADMEAHSGEASLSGWLKREVLPSLEALLANGGDWQALHRALANHGVVIRKRGAGLIIAKADGRLAAKASSIDRRLALQALTRRWGRFAVSQCEALHNGADHHKPLQRTSGVDALYAAYRLERPRAISERQAAFRRLNTEEAERREALRNWSKEATAQIREQAGLTYKDMRAALARHQAEEAKLLDDLRARSRREWRELRQALPAFNWHGFLRQAATNGNRDAENALRWHEARFARAIAVIHPANADWQTSPVIEKQFRPEAREDGQIYRTLDGGRIIDRDDIVYIPGDTRESILLALSILTARFPGYTVALQGNDAFVEKVIAVAAREKPDVRFDDPRHEAMRQRLAPAPERKPAPRRAAS